MTPLVRAIMQELAERRGKVLETAATRDGIIRLGICERTSPMSYPIRALRPTPLVPHARGR
jgi:hypothetical protein